MQTKAEYKPRCKILNTSQAVASQPEGARFKSQLDHSSKIHMFRSIGDYKFLVVCEWMVCGGIFLCHHLTSPHTPV